MGVINMGPNDSDHLWSLLGEACDTVTINDVTDVSGATFAEISLEMASEGANQTGLVTVAEASGIAFDRRDGASGVLSATRSRDDATDEANREFLPREPHEAPAKGARHGPPASPRRTASFRPSRARSTASSPTGRAASRGWLRADFELDDGMTIAELLPDQRNQVRPRALAVQQARPFLGELVRERQGRAYTRPHVSHRPRRR